MKVQSTIEVNYLFKVLTCTPPYGSGDFVKEDDGGRLRRNKERDEKGSQWADSISMKTYKEKKSEREVRNSAEKEVRENF